MIPRDTSVIVAVYNGADFIGAALQSILTQTCPASEICVVDDGSQDGTSEVVKRFATVRYVCQSNAGQAAALNRGISLTSGAFLAFLDADDVWMPDKLEVQYRALDQNPGLDVVYGLTRERVLDEAIAFASRDGRIIAAQLPSAMLIRREAFERVGGFDARYTLGSVVDFYARACEAGLRQEVLQTVVYERRIHGRNMGIAHSERQQDYLAVVKAALDRRRAATPQSTLQSSTDDSAELGS